jgi:hypothetical protein
MRIALRRARAEVSPESPRPIALANGGTVAPFLRRPSLSLTLGERHPARRLRARPDVPTVSRIVLRPLNLR